MVHLVQVAQTPTETYPHVCFKHIYK